MILHVPLGTRCSSAFVIKEMGLRQCSLPFDWVEAPLVALPKFFTVTPETVESFIEEYFKDTDFPRQRHPDTTWFPHDTLETIREKYPRRIKRLIDLISDKSNSFLFLTIVDTLGRMGTPEEYDILKKTILSRLENRCFFVSVNVLENPYQDLHHINYRLPLLEEDPQFQKWESLIQKTMQEDKRLIRWLPNSPTQKESKM